MLAAVSSFAKGCENSRANAERGTVGGTVEQPMAVNEGSRTGIGIDEYVSV